MATQYRFKTVMVSDKNRADFSRLRDKIRNQIGKRVTDKELFFAMLTMVEGSVEELTRRIIERKPVKQELTEQEKAEQKRQRLQRQLEKLQKATTAEPAEVPAEGELVEVAA